MIKSVVLSLLLCTFLVNVQSIPMQKNGRSHSPTLNRQKRTFGLDLFTPRDWSQFQATWRLPNLPLSPINIWDDEDLNRRVAELEIGQKRIIDYLRKLQAEKNAIPCNTINNQLSEKQDQATRGPATPTTTTTIATTSSSDMITKEAADARKEATTLPSTTANKETTATSATKETISSTTMRKDNVTSEKSAEQDVSSTTTATSVFAERVTTPTVVQAADANDVL